MDKLVRKIELPLAKRVVEKAGLYIVPKSRVITTSTTVRSSEPILTSM